MVEDTNATPAAEYSPQTRPCRFCEKPVTQPKIKGRIKDFCSDSHRAAYREREHQAAITTCLEVIDEVRNENERLMATLNGAATVLERFKKKPAK